jgi:hypothetical protein
MRGFTSFCLAAVAGVALTVAATPQARAQISISIGTAPACPYGYYDYAPYNCAAYGYYGPQWFHGSTFVGAGPWFHGSSDFHGSVNNNYDPKHGYKGPTPKAGEHYAPPAKAPAFKGNEEHDGHGVVNGHAPATEHGSPENGNKGDK